MPTPEDDSISTMQDEEIAGEVPGEAAENGGDMDQFFLRVTKGSSIEKGVRFYLDAIDTTIGRPGGEASIEIPGDLSVSAIHANIHRDGARLIIFDMDSVSGVQVNGQHITHGHFLNPGDRIRIGETEFIFQKVRRRADAMRKWWRDIDSIIVLALLAMIIISAILSHFGGGNEATAKKWGALGDEKNEDPLFPGNRMDWRSMALPENAIPIENLERAQLHYRQAMLCFRSKALDPRNAFSAIVAMKRVKASLPYEANPLDLPFPYENIDKVILGSQDYITYQAKKAIDGYIRARNISDFKGAIKCVEHYKLFFVDKFSKVHAEEYVRGNNELRYVYSLRDSRR